MQRVLVLGCVLALGCASAPGTREAPALAPVAASGAAGTASPVAASGAAGTASPVAASGAAGTASLDTGPPPCGRLQAHISGSRIQLGSEVPTWLAAPVRMVEARRLRALQARADELGCQPPRS